MVYLIGITGGSGSGKTTFTKKILNQVSEDVVTLHMDSYYLHAQPEVHRTVKGHPNFDHPEAFDWELLVRHLTSLKNGETIQCPVYDFTTSSRLQKTERLGPAKVIIFEGIYAIFNEEIRELLDIKCFLHVESDIRFSRRLHRDVQERGRSLESVIEQYYETVRPMYQRFLAPQKDFADFIVGEETDVAASILSARIRELLILTKREEADPEQFLQ